MSRRSRLVMTAIVLSLFTGAIFLYAQGEWCVDCGIEICTAPNDQLDPKIIKSGPGKAIIVWDDFRNGDWDVYAQGIDFDGNVLWPINGVQAHSPSTSWQYECQLTSDSAGGAIIVWSATTHPLGAQRIDAGGNTLWGPDGVVVGGEGALPQLIPDGGGGAIITWVKNRDIYAQRLNASGDILWLPEEVAICDTTEYQISPQIISDSIGGAIVVWQDPRNGNFDIYAQRVDANGNALWPKNGVAICDTVGDQELPQIIADGVGGAIITWEDSRDDDDDIYAQRVDGSGSVLWAKNGEVICRETNIQRQPQITEDDDGGAIITWHDCRTSVNGCPDIYAQRVDAGGDTLWTGNGVAVCAAAGGQHVPYLAPDGAGGAIIAWGDERNGVDGDAYAQRIDSNGNPVWAIDGILICSASGGQGPSGPVPDGNGGAIFVWEDFRNGNWDIYARRVYADGTFCPQPLVRPRGEWRYTFDEPDSCWTCLEYPDSLWDLGHAPFGNTCDPTFGCTQECSGSLWCTHWSFGDTLWVRTKFMVSEPQDWTLFYGAYNEAVFYINGMFVDSVYHDVFPSDWTEISLPSDLFHIGENVVAVRLRDDGAAPELTAFDMFIGMDAITSVEETPNEEITSSLSLYQNHPNPFNPNTTIQYSLREPAVTTLRIYDVLGRLVHTLVSSTRKEAGHHVENWDGRNSRGERVASGVYFYRLKAGKKVLTRKMVVLK